MSEFVIKKERFKFGILDKVPVAEKDECVLLYREDQGENGSIVIDCVTKALSADVRRGKFNVKVTFTLKDRINDQSVKLAMADCAYYFIIKVKVSYRLKNVREYFFRDNAESEERITKDIRKKLDENDKKWGMRFGNELERKLQKELENLFQEYHSLRFSKVSVDVIPDEDANKLIQSDKNKDIVIHTQANEMDVEVARKEQEGKVLDSNYVLQMKKVGQMEQLAKSFGEIAPVASEYLDGKMDGRELYQYIEAKREKDMELLLRAREEDWLTDQSLNEKLGEIIGNRNFMQLERREQLENKNGEQIEQKEKENNIVEDGDYL